MQPAQLRLASVRVLLVEDEPLILFDCEAMLRDLGVAAVVGVTTATDALSVLERQQPSFDVAILDVSLQDSSSLPLADMLAARGIATGFMSGYSISDLPEHLRNRPYIAKPFGPQQLARLLAEMLRLAPDANEDLRVLASP